MIHMCLLQYLNSNYNSNKHMENRVITHYIQSCKKQLVAMTGTEQSFSPRKEFITELHRKSLKREN